MENNTNTNNGKNGFFGFMYRTRIVLTKGETPILNLSLLFSVIALLCAPWLVIVGAIVALVIGYRFSIDRNASGFDKDFEHVVKDAANSVKHVVENVTGNPVSTENHTDDQNPGPQA